MKHVLASISFPLKLSFLDYPSNDHCTSIFMYGCDFDCVGCFNKDILGEHKQSNLITPLELMEFVEVEKERNRTNKIALLGGDPLSKENRDFTREFLLLADQSGYDVCVYTGNVIKDVKEMDIHGFEFIKTGRFNETKLEGFEKTSSYMQFATSNQCLHNRKYELLTKNGRYEF